ncbi:MULTISPECIES: hypothetical protein [Micromonospora]|uniref:Uncharacterized protein n=1 Tax=Micromonospora craniellae TaxID=2294034 RepID=A0A372FS24_9ACTN|nr:MULTISPECIES: hypothetical protein [Micromonospora]QOC94300.1 hypothetical protein ID554_12285 [Micromonospora craniellae]RFS43587.1 hypothetical protein D0Q02_26860 [Micromonospora craniellae]RNH98106.1 hypothetical protein EEZ25_27820 [Micromonospora aurantiaca]
MFIVRPATIPTPPLTAAQRNRRRAADQLASELTDAARQGRQCHYSELAFVAPMNLIPETPTIIAEASQVAAAPPPASLRVGRNLRGEPVAVVLHGDRWSLVVQPNRAAADRPATSWAFLDGYGQAFDMAYLVFCFDDDPSVLGVTWTDMINHVLALAS